MAPADLRALLEGDADAFTAEAVVGHAGPSDDVRWSLSVARGRESIGRALWPVDAELVGWAGDADDWFAECASGDESIFVAAQVAGGGIARALRMGCARIDPPAGAAGVDAGSWPGARPVVETYLGHLRSADFEAAAASFSEDCLYSHPPYGGGHERVIYRGRSALLHGFVHDRGPSPAVQVITAFAQRGAQAFIEGVVEGLPEPGTWGGSCTMASDGLIQRYVAFYGAPSVMRLDRPAAS